MAKKRSHNDNRPLHKREFHLPLPDSKIGNTLSKEVPVPKPIRTVLRMIFFPVTKLLSLLANTKLGKYVAASANELKKVTWPSRIESIRLTIAVMVFTAIFAAYTTVLDLGFERVVETLFL